MKVACVVGARPNFMKIGPVIEGIRKFPGLDPILVHTGQHYDAAMSKVFFEDLELPEPDVYLGVGSDSHSRQTAKILVEFDTYTLYVLVGRKIGQQLSVAAANIKNGAVRFYQRFNFFIIDTDSCSLFKIISERFF